jgi:AcrR family transcriptional regulator
VTAVIWMRPEQSGRGPRPAHNRAEIADAAIALADAEGLEAVSLRRLAAALGVGTTSLYRYVQTKDELFDLMVDAAHGRHRQPARSGDWRADLTAVAFGLRGIGLSHPWLPALVAGRPSLGPNGLAWQEAAFAAVGDLGLSADAILDHVTTLLTFVHGHVVTELAGSPTDVSGDAPADAPTDAWAEHVLADGRYPTLARIMTEALGPHAGDRFGRSFSLGVQHILDGLALHLAPNGTPPA